jgi:6-phosphogluconolactonase
MREQAKLSARGLFVVTGLVALCAMLGRWQPAAAQDWTGIEASAGGAVYTMTNASSNEVMAYTRAANGTLTLLGSYSTQGSGNSAVLDSQGSVMLTPDDRYLFVVNSSSNEVTSFAVQPNGSLVFVDKVGSGGIEPVSLSVYGSLLYVLNASGTTPNITGFSIGSGGTLTAIRGAVGNLSSSSAAPAQVGFNPDGTILVVTERETNKIDTYTVNSDGIPRGPLVQNSNGEEPFGFAFDNHGHLIVSESTASALSSYSVSSLGVLTVISGSVSDMQKQACWVANTNNSTFPAQHSYTANAGNGTISSYTIGSTGALTLLNARVATGIPDDSDMALVANSTYLYEIQTTKGTITGYQVSSTGSLSRVTSVTGIATTAYGLAAY